MMTRMASADIMCVGAKSVREKFSGIIRFFIFYIELLMDLLYGYLGSCKMLLNYSL